MKKVGFIGGTDKTNIITYIAKLLADLGKKVLVIDTTLIQKTRYIVPAINPSRTYITDFENVDYAVGFQSMQELTKYIGVEKD